MGFLKDKDFTMLIRKEVKDIISESDNNTVNSEIKLSEAEQTAIAQIKNYLYGQYDTDKIFAPVNDGEPDTRNKHIVMVCLDLMIYHLYTSIAPNLMPDSRANRYQDCIDWLKSAGKGDTPADLPRRLDENGEEKFTMRISSKYKKENQRW